MKIRVVLGSQLAQEYRDKGGLKTLHSAPGILVQGDSSVCSFNKDGESAFVCGRVISKRDESGQVSGFNKTHPDFEPFICSQSIDDCINRLDGRFMLVKADKNNRCGICCDYYGQAELYYQKSGDGAIFASSLDMLPFKDSKVKYDQLGIAHAFYIYGFRPPKRHTFYSQVKRLGVGEIALWQNNELNFKQVCPPVFASNQEYGKQELVRYSDTLLDAIKIRSSSKKNLVYLSSGWDSTAMLACLVHLYGPSKVKAVIGRFNFARRSGVNNPFELKRAKAVADYFGVELDMTEIDHYRRGPEVTERWGEFMRSHMFSGMSAQLWALMADYAASAGDCEEIFSGEISDGAHNMGFSQHTTIFHPVIEFREYSDKMASYLFGPNFFKSIENNSFTGDVIYQLLKQKYKGYDFDEPSQSSSGRLKQLFASMFIRNNRFPFWSLDNSKIFTGQGREFYDREMTKEYLSQAANTATPETLYSWYIYLYNSFHWQGGTVLSLASTAQNNGLSMNLPFYDRRLQEFLAAMPESWGRGLEIRPTKYPLKWMLENKVDYPIHLQVGPHSYLYDVDPDFNHAGEFIYASSYAPLIKDKMKQRVYEGVLSPEIFDMEYVNRIVDNYLAGKEIKEERGDLSNLAFLCLTGWY